MIPSCVACFDGAGVNSETGSIWMQLWSAISFRLGAKTESVLNSLEWNVKVILRVEKKKGVR